MPSDALELAPGWLMEQVHNFFKLLLLLKKNNSLSCRLLIVLPFMEHAHIPFFLNDGASF